MKEQVGKKKYCGRSNKSPKVLLLYIICRDEDATVIKPKHWSGATFYTPRGEEKNENKTRNIQNNTNKSIYYR